MPVQNYVGTVVLSTGKMYFLELFFFVCITFLWNFVYSLLEQVLRVLLYYGIAVFRYFGITVFRYYGITVLRYYGIAYYFCFTKMQVLHVN